MGKLEPIGDVLIRFSARTEDADAMAEQYREIHQGLVADRDTDEAYFPMAFLCAKAIERCSQLERGTHAAGDRRDRNRFAADRARAPLARPDA